MKFIVILFTLLVFASGMSLVLPGVHNNVLISGCVGGLFGISTGCLALLAWLGVS